MHYPEAVQVVQSRRHLMCNMFGDIFFDSEAPLFQKGKEISSLEILHDYIEVVLILKDIFELDDVWVLTNLQHLNLSL